MRQYILTRVVMAEPLQINGVEGYTIRFPGQGVHFRSMDELVTGNQSLRPCDDMDFGHALDALKCGRKVARTGWNGKGLWLELQRPDAHSKMTLPYIFMSYPDDAANTPGARVPWLASQTDMLAEDWKVVE